MLAQDEPAAAVFWEHKLCISGLKRQAETVHVKVMDAVEWRYMEAKSRLLFRKPRFSKQALPEGEHLNDQFLVVGR
ncbi:hypothetical protein H4S06_004502 [Coemansia sp. BCRC 34490]|nr:hypothetical protein H4S06_004502 [Coemansia sp. BCRC 34490]